MSPNMVLFQIIHPHSGQSRHGKCLDPPDYVMIPILQQKIQGHDSLTAGVQTSMWGHEVSSPFRFAIIEMHHSEPWISGIVTAIIIMTWNDVSSVWSGCQLIKLDWETDGLLQIRFGQNSRANGAEHFKTQNMDVLCFFGRWILDGFGMDSHSTVSQWNGKQFFSHIVACPTWQLI